MDTVVMTNVFVNYSDRKVDVVIEPWADEFAVEPGGKLEIQIYAGTLGTLCTVANQDHLAIWLWSGCRAHVLLNGHQTKTDSSKRPAP